ncbi:MAG: Smr/MutS family protein, partial [Bacteroidota bacterium]
LYHKKKTGKVEDRPIREGDFVRLVTGGDTAKVESIRKQKAVVVVNQLRMEVKLRDLVLAGSPVTAPVKGKINLDTLHSNAHFVNKLDLRGMRREEAMKNLESFVDEALIANGEELKIIHGKGDGILRKMIREHLKRYKEVSQLKDEHADRGGDGVTIVHLA